MLCLNYHGHFYYPPYACYAFTGSLSPPKNCHHDIQTMSPFCVLYSAFTAHLIFVDLALGLRAHSSADGLTTSLLTSL